MAENEIAEVEETEVEVEKKTIGQTIGSGIDSGIAFVKRNGKKIAVGAACAAGGLLTLAFVTKESEPALDAEDAGVVDFTTGTEVPFDDGETVSVE